MKKVCVLLAEGFEELEALSISDVIGRAGVNCDLVSMSGNKKIASSHGLVIEANKVFDDKMEYDLIALPGGMPGAANLRDDERVIKLLQKQNEAGKLIGAVCAAPIVLGKAGLTKNRNITSYPGYESELPNCNYLEDKVVVDKNIITSRGPATSLEFAYKLLEELGYGEEAKKISEGMLYNLL